MIATKEIPEIRGKDKDRFWSRVDKSGGPDACWPWTGAKFPDGYGYFSLGGIGRCAHRVAFLLSGGILNCGDLCLHGPCNNPSCCNPSHLSAGDSKKNNGSDKERDGTKAVGSIHGKAKLTESQVIEIRCLYESKTMTQQAIANIFGVDRSQIGNIVRRKYWNHACLIHSTTT
jgi:predicted XRE-type DNA-binding protein